MVCFQSYMSSGDVSLDVITNTAGALLQCSTQSNEQRDLVSRVAYIKELELSLNYSLRGMTV